MGKDNYITKPFRYHELMARIRVVLRRAETINDSKFAKNATISDELFDFCGAMVNLQRLGSPSQMKKLRISGARNSATLSTQLKNQTPC